MSASKTNKDIRCQPDRSCKGGSYYNEVDSDNIESETKDMATAVRGPQCLHLDLTDPPPMDDVSGWIKFLNSKIDLVVEQINIDRTSEIKNKIVNEIRTEMDRNMKEMKKKMTDVSQENRNDVNLKIERLKSDMHDDIMKKVEASMKIHQEKLDQALSDIQTLKNSFRQVQVKSEASQYQTQIIISGRSIPPESENEDVLQVAKNLIKEELRRSDRDLIVSARRFKPSNNSRASSSIVIETNSRDIKNDIIRTAVNIRPKDLYFNEMLPREINNLLYKLRKIKRDSGMISKLHTKDGVIKARKTNTGKCYNILTEEDMETFLREAGIEAAVEI